jgi:predicted metal-dependent hydrolase
LFGLDLFNHGYYWEAHEVWEGLWHAAGRSGLTANFMQALIKLAAAGVKAREARPEGVRRHSRRAAELFQQVAHQLAEGQSSYFGLSLPQLIAFATDIENGSCTLNGLTGAPVEIVFCFVLRPE